MLYDFVLVLRLFWLVRICLDRARHNSDLVYVISYIVYVYT